MKEKIRRFLWGRYGIDTLGWALVILSMILSFTSSVIRSESAAASYTFFIVSYALLIFAVVRMLSRNIAARRRENDKFCTVWKPVKKWFKLQYNKLKDFKTHRYFVCPGCKNNLRVPKGKGDITITCPKCKTKFDRKS